MFDSVFLQLGSSNCMWGYKRWYLPFSPLAGLLSFHVSSHPVPKSQPRSRASSGSPMPCSGSQVKEMVMAKRVPHSTFSTRCRFSDPEVKNDTRPAKTKVLTREWSLALSCSSPSTAQLFSGSSCSPRTWEPTGDHRQTATSLHCTLTAFYCLKRYIKALHTLILCAMKLEMYSHHS